MRRSPANPIITPGMIKPSRDGYRARGAFNPGAARFGGAKGRDSEILLLLRVAEDCKGRPGFAAVPYYRFEQGQGYPEILEVKMDDPEVQLKDTRGVVYRGVDYLSTMSHIRLARSGDGIHFTVDEKPFIYPRDPSECFGVEDARVTRIGEVYYINYTAVSQDGYATALATTKDFVELERQGVIFPTPNKDVAIFPEMVGGKYCALHRPDNRGFGRPSIWYSESPDLLHWGNHKCIVRPRDTRWESQKIGGGAPPLKTDEGWLIIYHGKGDNSIYSLFCLLLDLEEPFKVVKRAETPLLAPEEKYETEGFFSNVVFSNGVVEKDGQIYIYYGASDETSCVAISDVESLLNSF
ncbi:MAG: glycosidase [Phycisphaerae bacterium SM23_30]|nr:MAG: glycosidase [Phycisphaerae bacterium SM23_30]